MRIGGFFVTVFGVGGAKGSASDGADVDIVGTDDDSSEETVSVEEAAEEPVVKVAFVAQDDGPLGEVDGSKVDAVNREDDPVEDEDDPVEDEDDPVEDEDASDDENAVEDVAPEKVDT